MITFSRSTAGLFILHWQFECLQEAIEVPHAGNHASKVKVICCNIHWYHSDQAQLTEKPRIFVSMVKGMWDTVKLVAHHVKRGTILRLSRGHKGKEQRIRFKSFCYAQILCYRQHTKTWRRLVTRYKRSVSLAWDILWRVCPLTYTIAKGKKEGSYTASWKMSLSLKEISEFQEETRNKVRFLLLAK